MVGKITEIRVRQLQEQEALYDNPLEIWNYNQINSFKNNIIAKILCLIKDIGGLDDKYKFTSYKGEQKFYNIFEEKDFRKYKEQFKKKQIYTLDQIVNNDKTKLLEWKQISSKNSVILRGKIPRWFKKLEEITITDNTRSLKDAYIIKNNKIKTRNQRILLSTKIDQRKSN